MDGHVVSVFMVQASVTVLMLSFCMAMLARGADAGVYLPVMTGITGFWFPSPLQGQQARHGADAVVTVKPLHVEEQSPLQDSLV